MKRLTQILLFIYSLIATIIIVLFIFKPQIIIPRKISIEQLDAQQIRILEPDGTLRMVISDHYRLPGIIVRGKEQPFERPQAGMLFFNDEGSENGGLIFGGGKNDHGEVINSGGSLSFDRYDGNQEVQLIGVNDHEDRLAGMSVSDSHPEDHRNTPRIWVGRNQDGVAEIELRDSAGRKRMIFGVFPDGRAGFSFLDAKGDTLKTFDGSAKNK